MSQRPEFVHVGTGLATRNNQTMATAIPRSIPVDLVLGQY